jgi:glutamate synthase domain-containing protein 1
MCGIAGIFHNQGSPVGAAGVVPAMLDRMQHPAACSSRA